MYDFNVKDFPRLAGETDDAPRIQRAIDAGTDKVLFIPDGVYEIGTMLMVENSCSIELAHGAVLKAVKEMDYVIAYVKCKPDLFFKGGTVDGMGLASCVCINQFYHFTIRDMVFKNGKKVGLDIGGIVPRSSCEMIANNLYARCTMSGLKGNVGVRTFDGDSHFTDIIIVDYTIGFELESFGIETVGSNRLTRVHVWGGPVPPLEEGGVPEMLIDSISFRIACNDTVLRDCYSDTGYIGFQTYYDTRLFACSYYNNPVFKLDDITVFDHKSGSLMIADGYYTQHTDHATLYKGDNKNVTWRDNFISGKDLHMPE